MTLSIACPLTLMPALDLFAATVLMKPAHFKAAMLQGARSLTYTFHDDEGRAIAAAMLYPLPGDRCFELAFVCLPQIRDHLVSLIHAVHSTRDQLVEDGPLSVRALVRASHLPGHRLAMLCGMKWAGRFGAFDLYVFEGKHGQLHQHPVQRS